MHNSTSLLLISIFPTSVLGFDGITQHIYEAGLSSAAASGQGIGRLTHDMVGGSIIDDIGMLGETGMWGEKLSFQEGLNIMLTPRSENSQENKERGSLFFSISLL